MKRILQKRKNVFLAAIAVIVLLAGCIIPSAGYSVFAEAAEKKITLKPATDFVLRVPANWKNNYVMEKSKNQKHGSYVAFYAKKCHKETGDGWLFSIMRYKDDSYTDLPEYELVGKWGGVNYVAVFPTDIQTYGASKTAKKQYQKMVGGAFDATATIRPAKKRAVGDNIYRTSDFSLKLPAAWKDNYIVKTEGEKGNGSYVAFYAKQCHEETGEGFLFAITRYQDESYQELPSFELVGKWNGISYVAEFPTDVQFAGATEEAMAQYQKLEKSVEKTVRTILR